MLRKFMTGFVVLTVFLAVTVSVNAGGGDYVFYASSAAGSQGDSITSSCLMDNSGGDIQGWSFGICSDSAALTVDAANMGSGTATSKNGDEPDFHQIGVFADGATQGVVICFTGCAVVAPGTMGFEMMTVDYTIAGTSSTQICYCDTLNSPPTSTVVVVAGASIPPTQQCGDVTIINPNQLVASDTSTTLGNATSSTLSLNNVTMGPVDAVTMNVTYDTTILTLTGVNDLYGADFFAVQPGGSAGEVVMGILADDFSDGSLDNQIPPGAQTDLVGLDWDTTGEGTSAIAFVDGLGNPPQDNGVVVGQVVADQPTLVDGSVSVVNYNNFLRGDCNGDDTVNIADGIYGLNYLFQAGPDPICDDACDSNDDAAIDSSDMIYVFNYRFLEGPAPIAPFPSGGLDPTNGDGLGCNGDADDL